MLPTALLIYKCLAGVSSNSRLREQTYNEKRKILLEKQDKKVEIERAKADAANL
jgi:hypothetical protein